MEAISFCKSVNSVIGVKNGIENLIFGGVQEVLSDFAYDLLRDAKDYINYAEKTNDKKKQNRYIERAIAKLESAITIFEKSFDRREISNAWLAVGSVFTYGAGFLVAEPIKYLTRPHKKARAYLMTYFSLAACYIHLGDIEPLGRLIRDHVHSLALEFGPGDIVGEYYDFSRKCAEEYDVYADLFKSLDD